MTGAQALAQAVQRLRGVRIDDAARDARILLAHALGIERARLSLYLQDTMARDIQNAFDAMIAARETRKPVSQIIGYREFYGRRFMVSPEVLDPRPDTELLVEAAQTGPFATVLDLGTGSGCILLSLLAERDSAHGVGVDLSGAALDVAQKNAGALGLSDRVKFRQSDWFADVTGRFDLIVANPPYITSVEMQTLQPEVRLHEPAMALTPGQDGLGAYRLIAAGAGGHLNGQGRLLLEIGAAQASAVCGILSEAGFAVDPVLQDLNGHDRVVVAYLNR